MIGNDWDKELDIIWKSEGFKNFIKIINNETNEEEYLIMDEDTNEWKKISQDEYNKIKR